MSAKAATSLGPREALPVRPKGSYSLVNRRTGRVIFVGAGPGAADLITLRGARALATADVVLVDALVEASLRELGPQAKWISVGKRGFCDSTAQTRINALIVAHAQAGRVLVRLKGGDPSVFGRLEEELRAVHAAGLPCEVVPGVTAALAAAATTQKPLTRRGRGRSVNFATAMSREGPTGAGARADTQVFYMAGRQLAGLARQLQSAGWPADTPANVVSRASLSDEMCTEHVLVDLAQASLLHAGRPMVVTIGAGASAVGALDGASQSAPANAEVDADLVSPSQEHHTVGQALASQT